MKEHNRIIGIIEYLNMNEESKMKLKKLNKGEAKLLHSLGFVIYTEAFVRQGVERVYFVDKEELPSASNGGIARPTRKTTSRWIDKPRLTKTAKVFLTGKSLVLSEGYRTDPNARYRKTFAAVKNYLENKKRPQTKGRLIDYCVQATGFSRKNVVLDIAVLRNVHEVIDGENI